MNLHENITRVKKLMGLSESKIIYNMDLVELGGRLEDLPMYNKDKSTKKDDDFSQSKVTDVVWRAGELKLDTRSGGLWFGDSKDGVEKFAISVRNEKREGKPYHINLQNPYFIEDGFWRGYVDMLGYEQEGRKLLMLKLLGEGYDGIIINDDWWNDTGDENAVYGKQYVVFDEKDVKPA